MEFQKSTNSCLSHLTYEMFIAKIKNSTEQINITSERDYKSYHV